MASEDRWLSTRLSLILRVRNPEDQIAWKEFADRYRPSVVRFAERGFSIQKADAEEIAQEILLKLVKSMQSFEYQPNRSFRSWISTVTRHAIYSYFRKEKHRKKKSLDASREELSKRIALEIYQDLYFELEPIVRTRVSDNAWAAFQSKRLGQPAKDVATALGMSMGAFYQARARVSRIFREELENLSQGCDALE